jgi:hypothetical protein
MFRLNCLLFFLFFTFLLQAKSNKKLDKGFDALLQFDYFKAKTIFYAANKKQINFAACYGLSSIYLRNDNPFTNIDSALKYINLSFHHFKLTSLPYVYNQFKIDNLTIMQLADSVTKKQFVRALNLNDTKNFDKFLRENILAKPEIRQNAIRLRDELEYQHIIQINKSDSTLTFIKGHPMSVFYQEALLLIDRQLYAESTKQHLPQEWIDFLKKYPKSKMVNDAYEKLFDYYRKRESISGLSSYVKNYQKSPFILEAWKLLFSLRVKVFSNEELNRFLIEYPSFPLKNSILKELELSKLNLFPYKKDDYIGFIDINGQIVIEPVYDMVTDFCEGLSVVSKNDSVFFINKEKINAFNEFYEDASVFKNGIAPVKKNNHWYFINRQGQTVSKLYEEINELSNNIYVYKRNGKYGALDEYGQNFIENRFDKLGDFKNNMAYFIEKNKYGFVSNTGTIYKAEFDWISDFDEQHLAIFKVNNKFGIVRDDGHQLLDGQYDQIFNLNEKYFLIIINNLYGFYSKEGCFVTPIAYDYNKEKPIEYYCQGNLFKLLKKQEQAIMDQNGHLELNFGMYAEVNFMCDGLMLVNRKSKFGFIDKKLNVQIPFKYQNASSFNNGLSLVKIKDQYQIISKSGKEIFVSEKPISVFNHLYFIVGEDLKTLINRKGEVVFTNIINIQQINNNLMIVTFETGEAKLLKD